ncbi:hypothetical protein GCM10023189_09190 [Nibrella saemangeumensis]|uniref:Uncharacterized protein n=1 Tax=Nibrella saemangeumensis TaxID=1084526 RepID=A0ABP8MJ80_9BACT
MQGDVDTLVGADMLQKRLNGNAGRVSLGLTGEPTFITSYFNNPDTRFVPFLEENFITGTIDGKSEYIKSAGHIGYGSRGKHAD